MFLSKPGRGSPRPPGGTTAEPTGLGDEVSGNGFHRPSAPAPYVGKRGSRAHCLCFGERTGPR